ncbi:MAG: TIGR02996 domain-containing protein [Planctomycetes bacterium]|nr:TIGR02996 domain-containing protein [Planctomycetota bacterium]
MSDEDALLAAIIATPDEDTPRLVYADWLQENGQAERAEFIRLQIQSATLDQSGSEAVGLKLRAQQLVNEHASVWLEPLSLFPAQVRWVRGFVEHVTLTPKNLLPHLERLFPLAPVCSLELVSGHGAYGSLRLPASVEPISPTGEAPFLRELAKWPQLTRIRRLRHFSLWVADREIRALVESPFITNLQVLDLSRSSIGEEGIIAIANSANLQGLKHLCLFDNQIDAADVFALARSPYLQQAYLDLTCTLCDSEPDYTQAVEALTQRYGDRVAFSIRD